MSEKRKRVVLGLEELEVIKRLRMGETATSIAQIYGIGRTTWFIQAQSQRIPLSGPIIMTKAIEMIEKLDADPNFKASMGCLVKFKFRHGIRQLDISGEKLCNNGLNNETLPTEKVTDWLECDNLDGGFGILSYVEIISNVQQSNDEEVDDDEVETAVDQKPATSHSEAEKMLTKCIDWFERQEEANAVQILLLRKIRNIVTQKARASTKQENMTDYFKM
ncbi:hypothetical protein JTB14_036189 [Gonioctena quinquepunctata]|nr:hypothetical protein JTB14_036189 [Gonioctena quinquepunctata]